MSDLHTRCLDTFPEWLRTLASDATELGALLEAELSEDARRYVAGGLNYLFKSLDLIPDGIEDLGFLDDAFVVRLAASLALKNDAAAREQPVLARLAHDTALVSELLGKDYARLERYVQGLRVGAARGRTVDEIISDAEVRRAFLSELSGWSSSYAAPSFSRDEKNIIKLQSFLNAKLPA
ncbi:MAG: YkvA family protein [Polyangiaceae bacterium]